MSHTLIKLAQSAPVLIAIDDLQWAGQPSLDLFGHIVFAVADTAARESIPLLIIGTYRPMEPEARLARLIARLQREGICQTLELSGLDEPEIYGLLQGLGLGRPSHQLITTVSEATQGNPLFVQEVAYHLRQQDALQELGGYVVTTAPAASLRLPEQVTGAILARTQGLSEDCRRVLVLASFLGESFSLRSLGTTSNMDEDALLNLLEEGMRQGLLLSQGQGFQFTHALIQHIFYNEPSVARRQRLHAQIARILERLYADRLDDHVLEIAHHLVRAGSVAEAEKVPEYARRAGDQAFAFFAWTEAADYYEAALSTPESTTRLAVHDRAELHYLAGLARYRDMDVGPSLDHYEKAIEAYRLAGDVRGLAQALMEKTHAHFTLASVAYGTLVDVQPLEAALEALGDQEAQLQGCIWATIAEAYWTARQPENAKQVAQRALEIGRHLEDDRLCVRALQGLALAQTQTLHVKEALENWQAALFHAQRADDLWLQGWPIPRMALILVRLGRLDEAETMALEACEVIRKTQSWGDYSMALAALVSVAVIRGDFEAVERYTHETMQVVSRSRYPWSAVFALPALACARTLRGAWAAAEDALDMLVQPGSVFENVGATLHTHVQIYRQLLRAYTSEILGEPMSALAADLLPAGGIDASTLAPCSALVEMSDLMAVPTLAEPLYQALTLAAERGVLFSTEWAFLIPRILGVAAASCRWWDTAEAHFQEAINVMTNIGAQPELGRSCLDYARMLAARGGRSDRHRAIELVSKADLIFSEFDMAPFTRQAAQLAEALQPQIPLVLRQHTAYSNNLVKQEVEALVSIAWDRTNILG